MRTIAQSLKSRIHYPLDEGLILDILEERGIDGSCETSAELRNSTAFKGAVADCLYSLIEAPNCSESDISISLQDRDLILKKVNAIYTSIGEEAKDIDQPKVYIGW